MIHPVKYEDLGLKDYLKTWKYQETLFREILEKKKERLSRNECQKWGEVNYLLFVEHPNVYTLGKSGSEQNLLISQVQMKAKNASYYKTDRGGDITYHGPGQIVGYPIFDLENFGISIRQYIFMLEESIISTLGFYGIKGERLTGASGVWIDPDKAGRTRKICAIGVKASRYVTMHGFAFNVNTDLSYFSYINPCGFTDRSVTSLASETNKKIDINEVKQILLDSIKDIFQVEWIFN
jgi:lipoyl(octanoyl) transferase